MKRKVQSQQSSDTRTNTTNNEEQGVISRGIQLLFDQLSKFKLQSSQNTFSVYLSFLQIYNEKLYDCLQDYKQETSLRIREYNYKSKSKGMNSNSGIYIEGLTEYSVGSVDEWQALINRGERTRVTRQTHANVNSSRSHSIIQLLIETTDSENQDVIKRAKLNFCDLAGSEKLNK